MKELKSHRGVGPFVAKSYWSILNCFRRSRLPDDLTYAECGPGAREFLLLVSGYPRDLLVTSTTQQDADFFNVLLLHFRNNWRRLLKRRIRKTADRRLVHWLKTVQAETLASLESLQFMCCECSKVLRYLVTRDPMYLRHRLVAPGDASEGHECEADGDASEESESEGASVVREADSEHDVAEEPETAGRPRGRQMGQTARRPASCQGRYMTSGDSA